MEKYITSLHLYPIKGCRGIDKKSVDVDLKGPSGDRRWVIVDEHNQFLSQRQLPQMALIEVQMDERREGDRLQISVPAGVSHLGENHLVVPVRGGESHLVKIWRDSCLGVDQGDEVAEFLSKFLGVKCRLIYMPDSTFRAVKADHAIDDSSQVGFADGFPFLLISEASLMDLNSRLKSPVGMDRFRPNLVVSGCEPYEEDRWKWIRVGSIRFKVAGPCSRCIVINNDQKGSGMGGSGMRGSGMRGSGTSRSLEPLQTLSQYRKMDKGIMMGQNLIHDGVGTLNIGDRLEVLEWI